MSSCRESTGVCHEPEGLGRRREEASVADVDVVAEPLHGRGIICGNGRDKCDKLLWFYDGRCRGGDLYAELGYAFARRRGSRGTVRRRS